MHQGLTLEQLAVRQPFPVEVVAAILEDEVRRGHVMRDGHLFALTERGEREVGEPLRALATTRREDHR